MFSAEGDNLNKMREDNYKKRKELEAALKCSDSKSLSEVQSDESSLLEVYMEVALGEETPQVN